MTVNQFEDAFHNGVRVQLNWQRLVSYEPFVTRTVCDSTVLLDSMFTVWYEDQHGGNGDWCNPGRPLQVSQAERTESDWPEERRQRVSFFEKKFSQTLEPVQLILPTYALGRGGLLLLDGTHRAVAAHRASVRVSLDLHTVHGPVDEDILPDLRHYAPGEPLPG
ncbi:hypothetical protein ACG93S_11645 [Streptomyces sp. WAC01490]|uniref:hypothetical protein n=1 Tax=unclassified Streptomyces TaxID=2593676 RepID=UPI003F418E03